MSALLVFITLAIYAVGAFLVWQARSPRFALLLVAGHLAMLLTPLWQRLYGLDPADGPQLPILGGYRVPLPVIVAGGALLALPVMLFYYGLRRKLWPRHYAAIWAGYGFFVVYFFLADKLLAASGAALFGASSVASVTRLPPALVQAMLIGGVAVGILYAVVSTRHYGLEAALLPLLLSGLASSLVFLGVFGSPLWVAGLLGQSGIVALVGGIVSLALVLWGVHLLASGLHAGRRQQFVWR